MIELTGAEQRYVQNVQDNKEAYDAAILAANKIRENLKAVLATQQGRDTFWFMLESCDIFSTTFTGNSWQAYKEGRRSIGLEMLELITVTCPEHWIKMQTDKLSQKSFNQQKLNK